MKKVIYLFILISIISHQADAQWIAQNSGTNENLYDIEFLNNRIGWAVGDAGVVIKTTNGGANWINVPNPSIQYGGLMWSIQPVDSEVVYAVAGYDFIMKTSDGGNNWIVLSGRPGSITAFKSLYFVNRDTGWFLGSYKVFRTYDGGVTLDSFYAPWFDNFEIHFKDAYTGVFCGTGRVFKSTDQGESWFDTNVPVGTYFYMFRKLATYGNSVWISGNTSPVYRSTDYCETWETLTPGRQIGGYSISFVNDNTGYVGRSLNNLLKTTDGGYNWYQQRTDPNSQAFISSISFSNDTIGWYSCAIGRIYKTTTGGQWITNVSQISNEMPHSFGLNQNFPNPFNSQTEILFSIAAKGNYTLEIYDTKGNRMRQLLDHFLNPGNYSLNYDAETLSSGVYFYRLSGVQVSSTRKMILLR
jgi:photosystem II stability/assembly factor-like uncharacterized protein